MNSSERNDARVVVYPRYMSEKAVWTTQMRKNMKTCVSVEMKDRLKS